MYKLELASDWNIYSVFQVSFLRLRRGFRYNSNPTSGKHLILDGDEEDYVEIEGMLRWWQVNWGSQKWQV